MTTIDIARESARESTGQFGEQEHTAPETGLSIGAALSTLAVHLIRSEAPIGAVVATVELDETTGALTFFRYEDHQGVTLSTDAREDIDEALLGASIEAFSDEYDVTESITNGERWFDVDLGD